MTAYKYTPGSNAEISLEDATTGTGAAKSFNDCRQVNWLIEGEGTINAGTVIVESAHAHDYAGTWNELDTVNAADLTGGKLSGNTYPMPPGGFVRARIGVPIAGGGTITARLNGLQG